MKRWFERPTVLLLYRLGRFIRSNFMNNPVMSNLLIKSNLANSRTQPTWTTDHINRPYIYKRFRDITICLSLKDYGSDCVLYILRGFEPSKFSKYTSCSSLELNIYIYFVCFYVPLTNGPISTKPKNIIGLFWNIRDICRTFNACWNF